jgi:hypothetical protein
VRCGDDVFLDDSNIIGPKTAQFMLPFHTGPIYCPKNKQDRQLPQEDEVYRDENPPSPQAAIAIARLKGSPAEDQPAAATPGREAAEQALAKNSTEGAAVAPGVVAPAKNLAEEQADVVAPTNPSEQSDMPPTREALVHPTVTAQALIEFYGRHDPSKANAATVNGLLKELSQTDLQRRLQAKYAVVPELVEGTSADTQQSTSKGARAAKSKAPKGKGKAPKGKGKQQGT